MVAHISIKGRQLSAHRMIQRWGGMGYLLRDHAQRVATMARMDYLPKDRGLFLDGSSNIRISVIGLAVAPDHELDLVIYKNVTYRIILPVVGPKPESEFIYYDCNCVETTGEDAAS